MSVPTNHYWSLHTHSRYSANDAMPKVPEMVSRAVEYGYPALGLTDHGTMSGSVQLYKECRKVGIEPLPGIELYVTPDRERGERKNYHLTVAAYSERGYRNLVKLNNLAMKNYWYKPLLDMADFAQLAEDRMLDGLVASTGCYFGLVQQTVLNHSPKAARKIVETLAGWFPRVYVELHNHQVTHDGVWTDEDMVGELVAISEETGIPYIIAQDSHYLDADQQWLHDGLKTLVSWSEDPSEATFPGGPYSMVGTEFFTHLYDPQVLSTAVDNLADLAEAASVRLPELESFSMKVPDVTLGGDPDAELRAKASAALTVRYGEESAAKSRIRESRLNEELDVIATATMSGYILLVAAVCDFMRSKGIWFHARGSASGSLVCQVLGITQVDPLKYGLRMDRFMSTDRTRPPDIDLDVEHRRRDEVIAWLQERFSVRQVGSHMQYSLIEDEDSDDSRGSLLVRYHSTARKQFGRPRIGEKFVMRPWAEIPDKDREMLQALGGMKLISGPGTHAAGYIVAPDEASVAELPLTWMAGTKKYVTSYGKKDVEALGFVKLDLLGLRNLTAERITCEAITGDPMGAMDFWEAIPDNDKEALKRIGSGHTDGVFQLEGYAMMKGCTDLKPRHINDIIAAQTLFRPATRESGATQTYIDCRKGNAKAVQRHDDIWAETKETYGVLIYQEQLIGVCRRMGMPSDELTDMLDAVKASNEGSANAALYLEKVKPRLTELATARGWTQVDIDWLLDALVAYAQYGFNKAHAASYGLVSYRTAWLAHHFPTEFWLGMLTAFDDHKKESKYISSARGYGVSIAPAHVNLSGVTYSLEITSRGEKVTKRIRRGLLAVKGVGRETAMELVRARPFTSLRDLGERCIPRKVSGAKALALGLSTEEAGGRVMDLATYGALDGLE